MKDGQRSIQIAVNIHFDLHVVVTVLILGDLQYQPFKVNAIILLDGSLMMFTENIIEIGTNPINKS